MSVTNENQIRKSHQLIDGFRTNINELRSNGVTEEELLKMEKDLDTLAKVNKECDEVRAQMRDKSQKARKILTEVKEAFVEKKKLIKGLYPQEQWINYGIIDKR